MSTSPQNSTEEGNERSAGEWKVHYHLRGGEHRMDAVVRNKAESEMLSLLKEVSAALDASLHVESHAYGEGGLVEYLDLFFQSKEQIGFLMTVLGALLGTPFYLDKLKQSKQQTQLNELNIQKAKLEIKEKEAAAEDRAEKKAMESKSESLQLEAPVSAQDVAQALLGRKKVARRRSNYYAALLMEQKVDAVGFASSHSRTASEIVIRRGNFADFVITQSDVEPLVYERITLEVVSPVLRSGAIKWRGIFDKRVMSFDLQDQEFRQAVIEKRVQFQNGTTLVCDFEVLQREDATGEVEVVGYAVTKVHEVRTPPALSDRSAEQLKLLPDDSGPPKPND